MSWFDLLIVVVLVVSTASAFVRGFFLELFSLVGLFIGLIVAAEEYGRVAIWLQRWTARWTGSWTSHAAAEQDIANLAAFLLLALGVMFLATLVGRLLRGVVRQIGLGFLDRVLGAGLGFIKGCVVITLVVMAITAFLPQADYVKRSRLAPFFLDAAHQASLITPVELGEKIRRNAGMLHPATGR